MKIVFFATPDFVLPIANILDKSFNDVKNKNFYAVVTQPPQIFGRKKILKRSDVDNWAFRKNIKVIYDLNEIQDSDLGILASYGKIIPNEVINKFKFGILNIHPSLLPKYKGASPIQAALAMGENVTGVSIIKMDENLDHGPIVSYFKEDILPNDTLFTLRERLFKKSAEFLINLIPSFINGKIKLKDQDHTKSIFTKTIKKTDGFINGKILKSLINNIATKGYIDVPFVKNQKIKITPQNINNFIKSLDPWPNAYTYILSGKKEKRLKIISSHIENDLLILDEVQLEGKNKVSFEEFKRGYSQFEFSERKEP